MGAILLVRQVLSGRGARRGRSGTGALRQLSQLDQAHGDGTGFGFPAPASALSSRTSGLAADTVVYAEDVGGVVSLLDLAESRVDVPPEALLPVGLEVVGLVDIAPGPWCERADNVHRVADLPGADGALLGVRLVAGHAGEGALLPGDG